MAEWEDYFIIVPHLSLPSTVIFWGIVIFVSEWKTPMHSINMAKASQALVSPQPLLHHEFFHWHNSAQDELSLFLSAVSEQKI